MGQNGADIESDRQKEHDKKMYAEKQAENSMI